MSVKFVSMPKLPVLDDPDLNFLSKLITHPIAGPMYRRRFQMVLDFCEIPCERILEIGYGAGMMAYVLAPMSNQYLAIDIHEQPYEVELLLKQLGRTNLTCKMCDARNLSGVPDEAFDLAVSVSCLEHIGESSAVQREVFRILKTGGHAVFGLPVKNFVTKALFRIVGYDDSVIHPSTPKDVIGAAKSAGLIHECEGFFPPYAGHNLGLYWVGRFRKT